MQNDEEPSCPRSPTLHNRVLRCFVRDSPNGPTYSLAALLGIIYVNRRLVHEATSLGDCPDLCESLGDALNSLMSVVKTERPNPEEVSRALRDMDVAIFRVEREIAHRRYEQRLAEDQTQAYRARL